MRVNRLVWVTQNESDCKDFNVLPNAWDVPFLKNQPQLFIDIADHINWSILPKLLGVDNRVEQLEHHD